MDKNNENPLPVEFIAQRIYVIRGQKIMLDSDLAELYGVTTKALNQAVRRNLDRFPEDFCMQLTENEERVLRSQFVTSKQVSSRSQIVTLKRVGDESMRSQNVTASRGGRRYLPHAFTEQGIAMLSSVLRSDPAVQVNIAIMRAFVQLRKALVSRDDLVEALNEIKRDYGGKFSVVFKVLDKLLEKPVESKKRIGFRT